MSLEWMCLIWDMLCLRCCAQEPQEQMGAEDRCSPHHGDSLSGGWQHSMDSSQTFSFTYLLFMYFWLSLVLPAVYRLPFHCGEWGLLFVAVSGGYSSLRCRGLTLPKLLQLWSTGFRHTGSVAAVHVLQSAAQQLRCRDLVSPWHESSQTGD